MKSNAPQQWFPPSQLAFYFDQGAWSRGTTLYLQNKVVSSQLTPDGDGWRLQGQVEGSEARPYTVNAELRVSPGGLTAVTTADGRFTAMMPHPERVFRNVQMSWTSGDISSTSPWLRVWQNARKWVG